MKLLVATIAVFVALIPACDSAISSVILISKKLLFSVINLIIY
jgi:hypothetical protein